MPPPRRERPSTPISRLIASFAAGYIIGAATMASPATALLLAILMVVMFAVLIT